MYFLGLLIVFLIAVIILEILTSQEFNRSSKKNKITFKDEGQASSQRALKLLNEARLTAQANKPKS